MLLLIAHDINVPVPVVFPVLSAPVAVAALAAITMLAIRPSLCRHFDKNHPDGSYQAVPAG